jgi:putative amide transporter protein
VIALGLLFAGAVLLTNGLTLLGCCGASDAAPINAFVGILLVAVVASLVMSAGHVDVIVEHQRLTGGAGFLLFAITYLWVAVNAWTGASGAALGWYCLWAAGVALFLAVVNFARYHEPRLGMLWLLWTVLFLLFYLVLALGMRELKRAAGWAAVIESLLTTTLPGGLQLLGRWQSVSGALALGTGGIALALIWALAFRGARTRPEPAAYPDA